MWHTETWSLVERIETGDKLDIVSVAFDQDKTLAAGCLEGHVLAWNTQSWKLTDRLRREGGDSQVQFSRHGLLAFSSGNKVSIWKEETGESLHKL